MAGWVGGPATGSIYGDAVHFLEDRRVDHADGIPGEVGAGPLTQAAADALVEPYLDRGNGDAVFLHGDNLDAVHWAEGDADPAAGAVVLIHHSHLAGAALLLGEFLHHIADVLVAVDYSGSHSIISTGKLIAKGRAAQGFRYKAYNRRRSAKHNKSKKCLRNTVLCVICLTEQIRESFQWLN